MPFEYDYQEDLRSVQEYHTNEARVQSYTASATPELAANVVAHSQAYPYVPPKTTYALGTAGPPDSQLSQAVAVASINKKGGGFWSGGFGGIVGHATRAAIRSGFALVESPWQLMTAVGRDIASSGGAAGRVAAGAIAGAGAGAAGGAFFGGIGALPGAIGGGIAGGIAGGFADDVQGGANNPFGQTTLGQVAGQALSGHGVDIGSGYFPGGKVHEMQVKRAQEAAAVNGHALTGGRLLADSIFHPGSTPYNITSGILDAALIMKYDPAVAAGKELKGAREAGRLIIPSERVSTPGRALLHKAAGVLRTEAPIVDVDKAVTAVTSHPDAIAWAEATAQITSASKIRQLSRFKIPSAVAVDLAKAKTAQDVMDVASQAIRDGAVNEKRALANGNGIMSTVRAGMSDSRLLASMPQGAIDLVGVEKMPGKLDRAVDRFGEVMKNGGADSATRRQYLDRLMAVKTAQEGDLVIQDYFLKEMQGHLIELGFPKEKIDAVLGSYAKARDDMLEKLHSEIGADTVIPDVVLDGRLVPVAKAHTVSELVEYVSDIPDMRAVRRMTQPNAVMRAIVNNPAFVGSVTSMDHFMTALWRPLVLLRPAFTVRMLGEENARMIAAGMDAPLMHPFSLISKMLAGEGVAVRAAGVTGDAHALDDAYKSAMLSMNSIHHDAGIMSKFRDIFTPKNKEYGQAWAGHILNLHKDDLSRYIVENGIDAAKAWWWSGEGRTLREAYSAKVGASLTKDASNGQVLRQHNWINELTGEDPRLLHAVSAGFIPTEAQMSKGAAGAKWIASTDEAAGHWDVAPEHPVYFHGSSDVSGDVRAVEMEGDQNLVGPGFYTTENPDVASSYAKVSNLEARSQTMRSELSQAEAELERGLGDSTALREEIAYLQRQIADIEGKRPGVHRMSWKDPENPPQLLDLEKPLPAAIRRQMIATVEDAASAAKTLVDRDALHALLSELSALPENAAGIDIVTRVMANLDDADKAQIITYLKGLKIDGYTHAGGLITGGERHTVSVFFDPFKLGPAEFKIPHKSVFMPGEGTKGIPLRRTDGRGLIHPDAAAHLQGLGLDPTFKSPREVSGARQMETGHRTRLGKAVNYAFEHLMSIPTNELVRSPAFNQAYWDKMTDLMPLLSPEAKAAVLASMDNESVQLSSRARLNLKNAAERSTGGTIGLERVSATPKASVRHPVNAEMRAEATKAKKAAESEFEAAPEFDPSAADAYKDLKAAGKKAYNDSLVEQTTRVIPPTEEQLAAAAGHFLGAGLNHVDQLAKGHALGVVQKTFEGLTDRNAIEEATRQIAPFGHAWRQAGQKWARTFVEDPLLIRKAQRVMTAGGIGGSGVEGAGFFYKDDRGDWVFNYPATGLINKIVTGNPAPLRGHAAGFSMMSQSIMPGAGPMISIAASKILPNTPKWDQARQLLSPYGDPTAKGVANALLPPWAQKAKQAFDDPNMAGLQGNTTMEMARYLVSTGKYNTSTEEEVQRLMEAAGNRAQRLTMVRALAQFFLPSTPTPVPMAEDQDGRTVVAQIMVQEMQALQKKNPQTATEEFMNKYGDRGILFLQNNTRPTTPGTVETDKGYDFLRNNPDLSKQLPLTAGLFSPPGGDFDYNAYLRSISQGDRQKLTQKQMILLANDKVGAMIFYNAKDRVGTRPTEAQRHALAVLKVALMKQYPGFNTVIGGLVEKAKTPQIISELEKAVGLPKIQATPVGQAVADYLEVRGKLNEVAKTRGVQGFQTSVNTADLRAFARLIAGKLAEKTPGFSLVFDRVFDNEMSTDVDKEATP